MVVVDHVGTFVAYKYYRFAGTQSPLSAGIAGPIAAYNITVTAQRNRDCGNDGLDDDNGFYNECSIDSSHAAFISFAIFTGIHLLIHVPMLLWKREVRSFCTVRPTHVLIRGCTTAGTENIESDGPGFREGGSCCPVVVQVRSAPLTDGCQAEHASAEVEVLGLSLDTTRNQL